MNNGFESDRQFREWQAAVAMQYGIQPVTLPRESEETSLKSSPRRLKATPRRRATDKKIKK